MSPRPSTRKNGTPGRSQPRSRLLLLRPFSPSDHTWLRESLDGTYDIIEPASYDDDALAVSIRDADVALGAAIAPKVLAAAERLRYLQTPGAGLELLDLRALAARRVIVCKSTSHAPQVAEHAVAMLLALMRKVSLHDRLIRGGEWYRPQGRLDEELYQTDCLTGSTVGLVGYGAINQAVAKLLSGFDVKVVVHARHPRPGMSMMSLARMMKETDAVIIAVPLTNQTRGMVGAKELGAGNPGPYLVNVGRAEVIERTALLEALAKRSIRGAALDVPYAGLEAVEGFAGFEQFDTVVVSAHRAGTVRGTSPHLEDVIYNLMAFAQGAPLRNIVNCDAGY